MEKSPKIWAKRVSDEDMSFREYREKIVQELEETGELIERMTQELSTVKMHRLYLTNKLKTLDILKTKVFDR